MALYRVTWRTTVREAIAECVAIMSLFGWYVPWCFVLREPDGDYRIEMRYVPPTVSRVPVDVSLLIVPFEESQ